MTDQQQKFVTMALAIAAIVISIWGDWLKAQFRLVAAARLRIDVDPDDAPALYHHGWIEDVNAVARPEEWLRANGDERGRLRVHFFRVKVTNDSPIAAKSVTLWVRKFRRCDPASDKKALENVQPLRWSDFWRFVTDRERKTVSASDADVAFAVLPEHSSKYCDLCFYYDLSGPPQVGGFRRNVVYLAVRNLPSSSYAMDRNGTHEVHLHAGAENAKSAHCAVMIEVNWQDPDEPVKIYPSSKRRRIRD